MNTKLPASKTYIKIDANSWKSKRKRKILLVFIVLSLYCISLDTHIYIYISWMMYFWKTANVCCWSFSHHHHLTVYILSDDCTYKTLQRPALCFVYWNPDPIWLDASSPTLTGDPVGYSINRYNFYECSFSKPCRNITTIAFLNYWKQYPLFTYNI